MRTSPPRVWTVSLAWLLAGVLLLVAAWACTSRDRADGSANELRGDTPPATPGEIAGVSGVDLIAYTGADGGLFTIKPDGTGSRRMAGGGVQGSVGRIRSQGLAPNALFTWPTWSHDGQKLAMSRMVPNNGDVTTSIHVVDVATQDSTLVYENEPGSSPLIAADAPHYLYWSPDGSLLSFIASTRTGLTLFAATVDGVPDVTPVATQGPIYYSWARNGSGILMHVGSGLVLSRLPGLDQPRQLTEASPGFRVPAFSPVSSRVAYVGPTTGGDSLFLLDVDTDDPPSSLADVGTNAAFMWSPDGQQIAMADSTDPNQPLYERLRVIHADGSGEQTVVNESLLAFFWSPDGQWFTYATISPSERSLMWKVVSAGGGEVRELVEFGPSSEQFTMISFFDQYSYSNSLWSPDSSRFVFTGTLSRGADQTNGAAPSADKVYAVDIASGTVTEIASGRIAFWSWN